MEKKPDLLSWLGFESEPDFSRARPLGAILGFLIVSLAIAFLLAAVLCLIFLLGALIGFGPFSGDSTGAAVRNLGLVLAAAFGAPFLVWRAVVAQKQVDVAEQGQITERINKAVEGLGAERSRKRIFETPRYRVDESGDWLRDDEGNPIPAIRPDGAPIVDRSNFESSEPNLEVRIGSIYALERIARDSLRDHLQVMEILCAYIRENSPATSLEPGAPPLNVRRPRTDIQAALTVIGRRPAAHKAVEAEQKFRLDLSKSDLSFANFVSGDFSASNLSDCRLEGAIFRNAKLEGSFFFRSLLNFANFWDAELIGTRFDHAVINQSGDPFSNLSAAKVHGISVAGADISGLRHLGNEAMVAKIFGSKDTKLDYTLEYRSEKKKSKTPRTGDDLYIDEHAAFSHWCPYDSNDLAFGIYFKEFREKMQLFGWPHT